MTYLILGLIVFLGVHSVRIVADGWRAAQLKRLGEGAWKGVYSLLSLAGFGLIVWGYAQARQEPVALWTAPVAMRHVAALLTLIAFVLLVSAYVPRNSIKSVLHHPMVLAVKVWAFAHLLANGTLADLVLFGAFLAWAVASYASAWPPRRPASILSRVSIGPEAKVNLAARISSLAASTRHARRWNGHAAVWHALSQKREKPQAWHFLRSPDVDWHAAQRPAALLLSSAAALSSKMMNVESSPLRGSF